MELREKLAKVIKNNNASCLLFSGGLDTSILAYLNPKAAAVTVNLASFGEDRRYAKMVAKELGLKHYHKIIEIDEAVEAIPSVIKILASFDPAIPNDIVVYFGIMFAKEMAETNNTNNTNKVMTGDGSDELFAGYNFMKNIDNLENYIKRISKTMSFSSNKIGNFLGIKIIQPYLDSEIIEFALNIPVKLKIKEGYGKWILRKAFEDFLPMEIIWQEKRPLEIGSGTNKLREIISSRIKDGEFFEKEKIYPVKFLNKEHLYYYEIYKKEIGEIPQPKENEKECPYCGGGMNIFSLHCKTCGGIIYSTSQDFA